MSAPATQRPTKGIGEIFLYIIYYSATGVTLKSVIVNVPAGRIPAAPPNWSEISVCRPSRVFSSENSYTEFAVREIFLVFIVISPSAVDSILNEILYIACNNICWNSWNYVI